MSPSRPGMLIVTPGIAIDSEGRNFRVYGVVWNVAQRETARVRGEARRGRNAVAAIVTVCS